MTALASYLKQFSTSGAAGATTTSNANQYKATDILGDIHLLRYLAVNDIISFSMVRKNYLRIIICCFFLRINLIHYLIL